MTVNMPKNIQEERLRWVLPISGVKCQAPEYWSSSPGEGQLTYFTILCYKINQAPEFRGLIIMSKIRTNILSILPVLFFSLIILIYGCDGGGGSGSNATGENPGNPSFRSSNPLTADDEIGRAHV